MKITGQILKEAREKKGISITEVSLATKINSRILNAIEQGNLSKLPPKTFLRGFVLSYATFLGLDTDEVMKTFLEEMGTTRPSPEITGSSSQTSSNGERSTDELTQNSNNVAKIAAVIGIIVLVIIIILLKQKMDSYESEMAPGHTDIIAAVPVTEPTPSETEVAPSPTPETAVSSVVSPTATPQAAASPTPAPASTPTPAPTAAPSPSPSSQASPPPAATPTPTPKPSPTPAARVQDVTIEALDNVDIEAVIDGETKTIKLKPEQVHTIKASRKVSLRLSDGGAVSLIVNGIERGVPGDLGKPMKVDIP